MDSFVAIDVETANGERTSICAIGAVKVVNGVITDQFYRLVKPLPNYYYSHFTNNIHGIGRKDTDSQPDFAHVWPELKAFIGDLPLVAHNKAFDRNVLCATARAYGIDFPDNDFHCTLNKARRTFPRQLCPSFSLPFLAQFLGIPFNNHHNALADAEACAKIALAIL
ncbi:MAG: 3'-5' exonuclease [Firmicutes bacterium]|nr:3'-5' exonuclease [Bacillota bacterium]MCM1401105.1 3'-5' exonuclease [Bacteroides sp.]MCM1477072.1 3'-5' exonuclease [Bacteroides sp.]